MSGGAARPGAGAVGFSGSRSCPPACPCPGSRPGNARRRGASNYSNSDTDSSEAPSPTKAEIVSHNATIATNTQQTATTSSGGFEPPSAQLHEEKLGQQQLSHCVSQTDVYMSDLCPSLSATHDKSAEPTRSGPAGFVTPTSGYRFGEDDIPPSPLISQGAEGKSGPVAGGLIPPAALNRTLGVTSESRVTLPPLRSAAHRSSLLGDPLTGPKQAPHTKIWTPPASQKFRNSVATYATLKKVPPTRLSFGRTQNFTGSLTPKSLCKNGLNHSPLSFSPHRTPPERTSGKTPTPLSTAHLQNFRWKGPRVLPSPKRSESLSKMVRKKLPSSGTPTTF